MDIAKVYWRDSSMFITQHDKDEKLDVTTIESVGFLLKNTKDKLVITGDLIKGEFRRTLVIPKENISNLYINGKHV